MEICAEAKPDQMLGLFEEMRKDGIEVSGQRPE